MNLEKYPKTRHLARKLRELEERITGRPFPKLPRLKQITNAHCGPAVLSAQFSFVGVKISQTSIVKSLRLSQKIKTFGLNMKQMAKAARIVGQGSYAFWKKSNGKISDLDAIINKYKFPVGVEWQGVFYEDEDEDNGHFAIITTLNKHTGYLKIADSYHVFAGVDRKFRIKEFTERWWDENIINRRTLVDNKVMFVITPLGETWPKKLGMVKV